MKAAEKQKTRRTERFNAGGVGASAERPAVTDKPAGSTGRKKKEGRGKASSSKKVKKEKTSVSPRPPSSESEGDKRGSGGGGKTWKVYHWVQI